MALSGYDLDEIPWIVNDSVNWRSPKLYILFLQNLSVAVAFWGLLSFYHGAEKDLEWCDPWPKFLCIKGVVFATFWQSLTIQFMSSMGFVDEHTGSQIQNLLICIEMLIASLAHFYIFPYQEWADDYKKEREKGLMLRDTLALRDFVKDMRMMVTSWDTSGNSDSPRLKGEQQPEDENSRLLAECAAEDDTAGGDIEEGEGAATYFQHHASAAHSAHTPPSGRKHRSAPDSGASNPLHAGSESDVLLRDDDSHSRYSATTGHSGGKKPHVLGSGLAEREIELAQRCLLEKLQALAPEQFDLPRYVPPAASHGRGGEGELSSYLSTDDLFRQGQASHGGPPRMQSLSYSSGDSSPAERVRPSDGAAVFQPRTTAGDEEGFELLSQTISPEGEWSEVQSNPQKSDTSFGDETSV